MNSLICGTCKKPLAECGYGGQFVHAHFRATAVDALSGLSVDLQDIVTDCCIGCAIGNPFIDQAKLTEFLDRVKALALAPVKQDHNIN